MNGDHLKPIHHIPGTLVYQVVGNEIEHTIINGKIVMENRSALCNEKIQRSLFTSSTNVRACHRTRRFTKNDGKEKMVFIYLNCTP